MATKLDQGKKLKPEDIIKRAEIAQRKKDEFESLYRDAYEFALPQRQLYGHWEGQTQGAKKMARVFDSTAINSTQRFANRLQSGIFPQTDGTGRWYDTEWRNHDIRNYPGA